MGMTPIFRSKFFALAAAGFVLVCGAVCALRATTDFGPQTSSSTRSLSVGPEGLPGGVSGVSRPDGNSLGLRGNGGSSVESNGLSPSADPGTAGAGGLR